MIFFFDPTILILILLMVIVGGGYIILSNISAIILAIVFFFMVLYGIYTIFIPEDSDPNISGGIVRILRGLIYITISFYITILMYLGMGTEKFANANFPLLEFLHIRNFNDDFSNLILTCGIILIVSIPAWIGKALAKRHKFLSMLWNIIAIVLVFGIYIGGFQIAMHDSYVNTYNSFDYEMEEYEVTQDTNVYTEINLLFGCKLFKTNTISKGSKVYSNGRYTEKNDVRYYQINNGKGTIGYVSSECMTSLYEELNVLKKDSILYGVQIEESTIPASNTSNGEPFTIKSAIKINETICTVPAGTVVDFQAHAHDPLNAQVNYSWVILPDGTEGCILEEDIELLKSIIQK